MISFSLLFLKIFWINSSVSNYLPPQRTQNITQIQFRRDGILCTDQNVYNHGVLKNNTKNCLNNTSFCIPMGSRESGCLCDGSNTATENQPSPHYSTNFVESSTNYTSFIIVEFNTIQNGCTINNKSTSTAPLNQGGVENSQVPLYPHIFYYMNCKLYYNSDKQLVCSEYHRSSRNPPLSSPSYPNPNKINVPCIEDIQFYKYLSQGYIFKIVYIFYLYINSHQILVLEHQKNLHLSQCYKPQYNLLNKPEPQQNKNQNVWGCSSSDHKVLYENKTEKSGPTEEICFNYPRRLMTAKPKEPRFFQNPQKFLSPKMSSDPGLNRLTVFEEKNDFGPNSDQGRSFKAPTESSTTKENNTDKKDLSSFQIDWSGYILLSFQINTNEKDQNLVESNRFRSLIIQKLNDFHKLKFQFLFLNLSSHFFPGFNYTHSYRCLSLSGNQNPNINLEEDIFSNGKIIIAEIEAEPRYFHLKIDFEKPIFLIFNIPMILQLELKEPIFSKNNNNLIAKHIFTLGKNKLENEKFCIKKSLRVIFVMWNQLFLFIWNLNPGTIHYEDSRQVRIEIIFGYYKPNKNGSNNEDLNLKIKTQALFKSLRCKPRDIYSSILDTLKQTFKIPDSNLRDKKYLNMEQHFFFKYNDVDEKNPIIFTIFSKRSCILGLDFMINDGPRCVIYSCYIEFICILEKDFFSNAN